MFWFHTSAGNKRKNRGVFCSRACFHQSKRITLPCLNCRQPFRTWRCMTGKRKYCSQVCAGTAVMPHEKAEKFRKYDSPAWLILRATVLERDKWACQWCASGVDLIVHHIKTWRDSADDSMENLITVCRSCHAVLHAIGVQRKIDELLA